MFAYHHERVEAKQPTDCHYPAQDVQAWLYEFGREGWELVAIVPDWVWGSELVSQDHEYQRASEFGPDADPTTYTVDAPYSVSVYIGGWYCTFKRSI